MNDEQQRQVTEERQKHTESNDFDVQPIKQDENFKISTERLQRRSYRGTFISSIMAIVTLLTGFIYFLITLSMQNQTFHFDREYKTVSLYSEYAKLMRENLVYKLEEDAETNPWIGNTALFLAETIYKFNSGWHKTVELMLRNHKEFMTNVGLNCQAYDNDFLELTKQVVGTENICKTE